MLVLAGNNEINSVADIKDKVVGAQGFSDFSGAQAQFYVMYQNGLDFVVDPKQVIFTGMSFLRINYDGLYSLS
jgi:hypothetical protein